MKARRAIPAGFLAAAAAAAVLSAGSFVALQAKPPAQARPVKPLVAQAGDTFGLALYAQLAGQKGNVFFSPSSIHTALTMTYAGARNATAEQMQAVLALWRSPKTPTREAVPLPQAETHEVYKRFLETLRPGAEAGYELTVANALWGQKGYVWNEEFVKTTKDAYGAGLWVVDFAGGAEPARKAINAWVEKQTHEKIKDLLAPGTIDLMTTLVLTNAIYFKGVWAQPFEKADTQDAPFRLGSGRSVQAPLMHRKVFAGYAQAEGVQVLSLPYKGDELSMVVLLPRALDGLGALEKGLTGKTLEGLLAKRRDRGVEVYLPRFTMTCEFELARTLAGMGMVDAFDASKADFSGMDGKRGLFVSAVVHKAFVEVNEAGTEAAAATALPMPVAEPNPRPEPDPIVRADHPFLFLIRHNATGAILFMGRLSEPGK